MPAPEAAAESRTGDRFTILVSHADHRRYALPYAESGGG
jgi:hypothetical protein